MRTFFQALSIVKSLAIRQPVRNYCDRAKYLPYERKQYIRRRGYEPEFHSKGLLPRIPGDQGPFAAVNPENRRENDWHRSQALFGQNDYIDILGDGTIHPSRLLSNMPHWLRGFRGNELVMINRKRQAMSHYQHVRPKKWEHMHKRVNHLYKYLNLHHRPPHPERY